MSGHWTDDLGGHSGLCLRSPTKQHSHSLPACGTMGCTMINTEQKLHN